MGRPPAITQISPTDYQTLDQKFPDVMIRTRVPGILWELAREFGALTKTAQHRALQSLLVDFAINVRGKGTFADPKWLIALERVERSTALRTFTEIDHNLLHYDNKVKSGYRGVYMNTEGFRAAGPDPKDPRRQVFLGFFPTAELAAWKRYQHHLEHKLPYGAFADRIAHLRRHSQETDEELIDFIVQWDNPIPDGAPGEVLAAAYERIAEKERAARKHVEEQRAQRFREMGSDPNGRPYPRNKRTGKPIFPEDPLYEAAVAHGELQYDPGESSTEQPDS